VGSRAAEKIHHPGDRCPDDDQAFYRAIFSLSKRLQSRVVSAHAAYPSGIHMAFGSRTQGIQDGLRWAHLPFTSFARGRQGREKTIVSRARSVQYEAAGP
jgi:hypothetical protein